MKKGHFGSSFVHVHKRLTSKSNLSFEETKILVDLLNLSTDFPEDFAKYLLGWEMLGALYLAAGNRSKAIEYYTKAISLVVQKSEKDLHKGEATMKRQDPTLKDVNAISIQAQRVIFSTDYNQLGIHLLNLGKVREAVRFFDGAVRYGPKNFEAYQNLGIALLHLGMVLEAQNNFKRAITLKTDFAEAHNNLGITFKKLGKFEQAEHCFLNAISHKRNFAEAYQNLANMQRQLGLVKDAESNYKRAITMMPAFASAHYNLAVMLLETERLTEAEESFRNAVAARANDPESHNNLAITLQKIGKLEEAEVSFKQALAHKADFADAHNNLGNTLRGLGKFKEAEACYRKAISLQPERFDYYSNLVFLNSTTKFELKKYFEDISSLSDILERNVKSRLPAHSSYKNEDRLRVGFVSGDFKNHPVGYFLEGILAQLAGSSIEIYAYPTTPFEDDLTQRIRPIFKSWIPLFGKSDFESANLIHRQRLNILVDLSGHTANNRLSIFAYKPAPVQISWLGYWASTGVPQIDYVLGDPFVTPYKDKHLFTERIWQMPEVYFCFTPPRVDLEVASLPASFGKGITFGCFYELVRLTDEVIRVLAKILLNVPNSRVYFKDKQLQFPTPKGKLLRRFALHNVDPDRLILEGISPRNQYLECYNDVDIALSPFPYGGGTTTIEALWMGVPSIVMQGSYFLSHLGETIAINAGLPNLVAKNEEDYVEKAVALASDTDALSALRYDLRNKILKTPLFDTKRFACHFESALWDMWSQFSTTDTNSE